LQPARNRAAIDDRQIGTEDGDTGIAGYPRRRGAGAGACVPRTAARDATGIDDRRRTAGIDSNATIAAVAASGAERTARRVAAVAAASAGNAAGIVEDTAAGQENTDAAIAAVSAKAIADCVGAAGAAGAAAACPPSNKYLFFPFIDV
jgi:hypothetical protein